ncbi:ylmG homolog protein 1-2, chloroplastic-like [Arachis stenosperma]|uniref:ylmG homolog protein 1-2, chloroplastic-like n=1 Tax=Arachis stenosperma TaxID=217475 RepID=UPI0025AC7B59|nr:ylmG homolog protein 1-2, chloroplastic-like [Arachis stenosperma]
MAMAMAMTMTMAFSPATMASKTHMVCLTHPPLRQYRHRYAQPSLSLTPLRRNFNPLIVAATSTQSDVEGAQHLLEGSTRTLTTVFGMALLALRTFCHQLLPMSMSMSSVGPLFFASLRDRPSGSLNTPLTVVAAGLGKWLDIYSGVLMVRVLLSWFPNIPWEKQPLSAIRDLCDPYLNLFRNIIPPVFDTLDVSPLLAFAVLGTLGSILNTAVA